MIPSSMANNDPMVTFSGGIQARLSAVVGGPSPASGGVEWRPTSVLFVSEDVTLTLHSSDSVQEVSRLEIALYSPTSSALARSNRSGSRSNAPPLYSFPIHSFVTLTHANTKRGIAIELVDKAQHRLNRQPVSNAPPSSDMFLLQLSFSDASARERVYVALHRAWETEKRKQRFADPARSGSGFGGGSGQPAPSIGEVLQSVKKLQAKTNGVLAELRKQDEALFSADGEFALDPTQNDSDQLRSWALYQLKQRQGLDSAAGELHEIQQRRARRRALLGAPGSPGSPRSVASPQGAAPHVCPHCKLGVSDPTHFQRCASRPVQCPTCKRSFSAKVMQQHRQSCVGGGAGSSLTGNNVPLSPSSRFTSASPSSHGSFLSISPPRTPEGGSASNLDMGPGSPGILKKQSSYDLSRTNGIAPSKQQGTRSPNKNKPASSSASAGPGGGSSAAASSDEPQVKCPHCHRAMAKSRAVTHVKNCSYREVRCKACGEKFAARDFVRHQEVCKKRVEGATAK